MTPDEYIGQLGDLVAAGRDQEALDLAARRESEVSPPLSAEQIDRVGGLLESAITALQLREWEPVSQAAPTA